MTQIEQILAEIRRQLLPTVRDKSYDDFEEGYDNALLNLLTYIDRLSKEPASEDLEKAANNLSVIYSGEGCVDPKREKFAFYIGFKNGAKWQKEQFKKNEYFPTVIPEIEQKIGYDRGVASMHQQYLKDSISGYIARSKIGELIFFSVVPSRNEDDWIVFGGACISVSLGFSKMYPEVTWESEPIRAKLIITRDND